MCLQTSIIVTIKSLYTVQIFKPYLYQILNINKLLLRKNNVCYVVFQNVEILINLCVSLLSYGMHIKKLFEYFYTIQ